MLDTIDEMGGGREFRAGGDWGTGMAEKRADASGFRRFESTEWRVIVSAREGDRSEARQALADLCATYWPPLYAYLRRRGHSPDRAQDLTQGFFASLLGREFLTGLAPEKGKFRSFLLSSLQNYLANERDHAAALKRGGGRSEISIDLL